MSESNESTNKLQSTSYINLSEETIISFARVDYGEVYDIYIDGELVKTISTLPFLNPPESVKNIGRNDQCIEWQLVDYATSYDIYIDGEIYDTVQVVDPEVVFAVGFGISPSQRLISIKDVSNISDRDKSIDSIYNNFNNTSLLQIIKDLGINTDEIKTTNGNSIDITKYEKLSNSTSILAIKENESLSFNDLTGGYNLSLRSPNLIECEENSVILVFIDGSTMKTNFYEITSINNDTAIINNVNTCGIAFFIKKTS